MGPPACLGGSDERGAGGHGWQDEGSSSTLPAAPPAPHPRAPHLACPWTLSTASAPGPPRALEPGLLTQCIPGSITHCASEQASRSFCVEALTCQHPPLLGDLWRCEGGQAWRSPYDRSFGRFSSVTPEPGTCWLLCPQLSDMPACRRRVVSEGWRRKATCLLCGEQLKYGSR